jgi:hypothetical protein
MQSLRAAAGAAGEDAQRRANARAPAAVRVIARRADGTARGASRRPAPAK